MEKIIKQFKGGSLSSTSLIESKDKKLFVRKSISLVENREYGFQRWYSQLKRIQRYNILFPSLFPELLNYGKTKDIAYMDIQYFKDSVSAYEYIITATSKEDIDIFFNILIDMMTSMYKNKITSSKDAIELYINEEIDQRLNDCVKDKVFSDFLQYDKIIFNNTEVSSFVKVIDKYKALCQKHYLNFDETFTHGNITLENLLFISKSNKVIFIDPYEENIIDSELAEFSQLLQSSNAKYEFYNELEPIIDRNIIQVNINKKLFGLDYFNEKLIKYIKEQYTIDDYIMIRLFEISQFIRMLPFKMLIDKRKMIFFYGLASYLFHTLELEIKCLKEENSC